MLLDGGEGDGVADIISEGDGVDDIVLEDVVDDMMSTSSSSCDIISEVEGGELQTDGASSLAGGGVFITRMSVSCGARSFGGGGVRYFIGDAGRERKGCGFFLTHITLVHGGESPSSESRSIISSSSPSSELSSPMLRTTSESVEQSWRLKRCQRTNKSKVLCKYITYRKVIVVSTADL